MKKIILSILALSIVAGCSKEEAKETPAAPLETPAAPFVPKNLAFVKPAAGDKLTQSQIQEIRNTFNVKSMMILPPGELIFPSSNISQEEIEKKETELALKDKNSYDLLKLIQGGCEKGRPTGTIDASFPLDGNFAIENLRVNDRFNFSESGSLFGSSCPVDISLAAGLGARVDQVDPAAKSATASASSTAKIKAMMLEPKYAELLKVRGILVDSSLSGVGIKQESSNNLLVNYNLTGSYYSLTTQIPYSAQVQFLSHKEAVVEAQEAIISTQLTFSNFIARIDYHARGFANPQNIILEEIYVNGYLLTRQEFDELFGNNNPAAGLAKNSVVELLK